MSVNQQVASGTVREQTSASGGRHRCSHFPGHFDFTDCFKKPGEVRRSDRTKIAFMRLGSSDYGKLLAKRPKISSWTASLFDAAESKTFGAVSVCQLPKLDVAGSIPVSRSFTSTTWKPSFTVLPRNYRIKRELSGLKPIRAVVQL